MTEYTEENESEPSQTANNNSMNVDTRSNKQLLKRTVHAVVQTERTTNLTSNNNASISAHNGLDHNYAADEPPKKKTKVIFINKFSSRPMFSPESPDCEEVSLKSKLSPYKNDLALERIDDRSSSVHLNKLVSISTKGESKISGNLYIDESTNRLHNDKKCMLKDEKKFETKIHASSIKKESIGAKNSIEQFKFLSHACNLKIQDNYKFALLFKMPNASTEFNEIYCFKKQINCKEHYSLIEVKYLYQEATINCKQLFSSEFDLRKYFVQFIYVKELSVDSKIDEFKIYCNRDLNRGALQKNDLGTISPDGNSIKFKVNKKDAKYRNKFVDCCVLPNLAKKILECINENKPMTKKFKLFKKYHAALINEKVLKVITKEQNGSIINVANFHEKFLNNDDSLSEPAKELRKHIISNLPSGLDRLSCKMFCKVYDGFGNGDSNSILHLPHENYDELFEEFFDVFQFEIIDKDFTIRDTLGSILTEVKDDRDLKILQDEFDLHLKERRNINVFQSLNDKISKIMIKRELEESIEPPKVNIDFEPQVLEDLKERLNNFKSQAILLYLSDYIHLSVLKIKQLMSRLGKSVEKSLFTCSKKFVEKIDDVINMLTSDFIEILVIQLDRISNKTFMETALTKVKHSLTEEKRVIVVTSVDISQELDYNFKQICRENQLFASESWNEVLNFENVYLHGHSLRLTDIVDRKMATELMNEPHILEDILYRKLIIGNDLVKPDGFKEKLFEIQLTQYVVIDQVVFRESSNDIFAICNIDYKDFQQYIPYAVMSYSKFILLGDENDQELQLKTLSEMHSGHNVHLISFENENFVWKKTIGNIGILVKHKISGANRNDNERAYDVSNDEYKTTIISGRSGMGKSVCLYDLAERLVTSNDILWLIQLNLKESLLEQDMIKKNVNCSEILATTLGLNESYRKLLNMVMNEALKLKIVLFIDGYDELKQESSRTLAVKYLAKLQTSHVHKIYVASKSKYTRSLETALDTFSYSLKFSDSAKEQFLQKYQSTDTENLLKSYPHLTHTPLQLRMLAELCQDTKNLKSLDNIYNLYREYVKLNLNNNELETACKIAVLNLRGIQALELPNSSPNSKFELPEKLRHETFTEYFIAIWLFRKSYRCSEDKSKVFKCVKKLEEQASLVFINTYQSLFTLDSLRDELFEAVKAGNLDQIQVLLKDDCLMNVRDESGKCVLHHVDDDKTMELLIAKKYIDVNATDFKRQTPLHFAVDKNLLKSVILLLKAGASYDLKDQCGHRPWSNKSDKNDSAKMLKMINKLFKDILSRDPKILVTKSPDILANYLSRVEKTYGITPDIIVNIKDRKNNTLLDHAKKIKYLAVAQSLRSYGATSTNSADKGNGEGRVEKKELDPERKLHKEANTVQTQNMLLERFQNQEELRDLEITWENDDPNSMSDDTIRLFSEIFDKRNISIDEVETNVFSEDSWLDDNSMDYFLRILKSSHPDVITQSIHYQYIGADRAIKSTTSPSIQIIGGSCIDHWRCLHFNGKSICIYDSKYSKSADAKLSQIEERYVSLRYPSVAKKDIVFKQLLIEQPDGNSCGVYAAAFAETLSSDGEPASVRYSLDAKEMRRHFMHIIKTKKTVPFPRNRN